MANPHAGQSTVGRRPVTVVLTHSRSQACTGSACMRGCQSIDTVMDGSLNGMSRVRMPERSAEV